MLLFPFAVLGGYLIQPCIAFVADGVYSSLLYRLADRAAGFFEVRAVVEAAAAYVRLKFGEAVLQFLLRDRRQLLHVEGGKARSVRHPRAPCGEDLHVPRGMPATSQLFTGFARFL